MKKCAVTALRSPMSQLGTSLVSASIAVQVQTSPASFVGRFMLSTFFALAPTKLQISSHWLPKFGDTYPLRLA